MFLLIFVVLELTCSLPQVNSELYNRTMEWGTYNPQLFFAFKNRSPNPFTLGLIWRKTRSYSLLRHETPGSDIHYGWEKHDGSHFGRQIISDRKFNLRLTTEFLKSEPEDENTPPYILARITGEKLESNLETPMISLMPYLTTRKEDAVIQTKSKTGQKGVSCCPIILMDGEETFRVYLFTEKKTKKKKKKFKVSFKGGQRSINDIWKMGDINKILHTEYLKERKKQLRNAVDGEDAILDPIDIHLDNKGNKESNYFILDYHLQVPFTLEMALIPKNSIPSLSEKKRTEYIQNDLLFDSLTSSLKLKEQQFDEKFNNIFKLQQQSDMTEKHEELGKFALSNLLGGLGYFYGDIIFEDDDGKMYRRNMTQFSGVPSRSLFPRPFLWDEGFHLHILQKWDREITKDVLLHWYHTVDPRNGWIPREQILGDEGRSRVPEKFVMQSTTIANPPTLLMALEHLIFSNDDDIKQSVGLDEQGNVVIDDEQGIGWMEKISGEDKLFLEHLYPFLRKNYFWYFSTQKKENRFAFMWGGRTENHTLASGFDDYPRGTILPSPIERHLDLYCWMYMMTCTMLKASLVLEKDNDIEYFSKMKKKFEEEFYDNHYDESQGLYADFVGNYNSNFTSGNGFSNHFGYVSFFPLFSGLVKAKDLGGLWNRMFKREFTLTKYGLSSLARNDQLFGTKENYWRGKIWLNINFMVLRALKGKKFAKKGYNRVRDGIVRNMLLNYNLKGTIFENYDPNDGDGTGTSPFCGWSALILLIMSEEY